MSDTPEVTPTPENDDNNLALERNSRSWLWILLGVAGVVVVAIGGSMLMGKSVVYYKTPTEVSAMPLNSEVRLAGKLLPKTIVAAANSGKTTFSVTDGKTTIEVVYVGSASTALSTAAKPGTQIVAQGKLGANHQFESTQLLAKCPSKYSAKLDQKTTTS